MTAWPQGLTQARARQWLRVPSWMVRCIHALCAAMFVLAMIAGGSANAAEPVKGEVKVSTDGGYARLIFRFDEAVDARYHISGSVLVINFKTPVNVAVDQLSAAAPDYIGVARRDPDGSAVRIALTRKVKVNTIPAAERFYVDLLPDTWTGVLPGLPQEVIDELARRARDAERQLHRQRLADAQKTAPLIRVKVATQPTFIRYIFEMPDTVNVVPERADGKLTLNFDQQVKWDLADVQAVLPPEVKSVASVVGENSTAVTFVLSGTPKVHTFQEDRSIVVDVATDGLKPRTSVPSGAAQKAAAADRALTIGAPETVPVKDAPSASAPDASLQKGTAPAAPAAAPVTLPAASPVKEAAQLPASPPASAPQPDASVKPDAPAPAAPAAHVSDAPAAKPASAPLAPVKSASPSAAKRPAPDPNRPVAIGLQESGDTLELEFPFATTTPAAVFRRADVLWLVFDSAAKFDLSALTKEPVRGIRSATFERAGDGAAIVRIKLTRPRLASLASDGPSWNVTIGDMVTAPTQPVTISRTIVAKNRANIAIAFSHPNKIHKLRDPEVGDDLMVVTALSPARGILKPQHFVELRALASTQGVVVQPIADDVTAELGADKITISRPGGLSLSQTLRGQQEIGAGFRVLTFDPQTWGADRKASYLARQSQLIRTAAAATETSRKQARYNLARFYLARGMAPEAKGVLDVAMAGQHAVGDVTGSILKAVAHVMLDRPDDAIKDLSGPQVGNQQDAQLWRAIAFAREGKWPEAQKWFKDLDDSLSTLPIELQRMAMKSALRTAIEVRDFSEAEQLLDDFETLGVPPDFKPSLDVLAGRLYEGLGRNDDALANYRAASESEDRAAIAQGRLREIKLLYEKGEMPRAAAVTALETLTTIWRGDETETGGLKLLAHIYTQEGRYRDAFHVMRTALLAHPNSDQTRQIQDEAASTFESLFLGDKGDALPPIEALGLFYDYRELTPIGRRGDEMIRRLADRLVAVDLLDQAAELLQHQVDHRLQGAARAQVATRLAVIYLMNRKPDRALVTLQSTRTSDLTNELRDQRLLLEARALSDIGRHDVALELIANIKNREAIRLRSGILWASGRWREASEQIEMLYGMRWREFTPLNEAERSDILRAAVGYALSDETIGLARLREKYAAKMVDGPDRRAFEVVSAPIGTNGAEFQDIAKRIAGMDTLNAFLRDMSARYPETVPAVKGAPAATSAPPSDPGKPQAANSSAAPAGPSKPDPIPTGSIPGVL
jgi:tetratricopeptide (TPR) repeat protein